MAAARDSEEEIAPSPNMRRVFIRLQERRLLTPGGGSSAISGPASQSKDGTAPLRLGLDRSAVDSLKLGRQRLGIHF